MAHSPGQRLSRCLLAVLAITSPLVARGDEGKLAAVIDLKPRQNEPATRSPAEPQALVVAAKAFPLLADTKPPAQPLTQPPAGLIQLAAADPVVARSKLDKPRPTVPRQLAAKSPPRSAPLITEAVHSPIEPRLAEAAIPSPPTDERARPAMGAAPSEPRRLVDQALTAAAARAKRSSPVVELAAEPVIHQTATAAQPLQPKLATKPQSVLPLVEPTLPDRLAPEPLTEEQSRAAEELDAIELDVKPIRELSTRIAPQQGELPKNYAAGRFAREGEIGHRMGYSRTQTETLMTWEAPSLCYRPLYFEDINLERHGYKTPLIQPALSAAHFFGRVPLLPYMMVSEGHRQCRYPLGHYQPGDYAPYSLYIPRLRFDATAAEAAAAAAVFFVVP